jgi:2-dehydro-3-deoxygluconokinase
MKLGLPIKARTRCQWDFLSLGEVMLRLDPGAVPARVARSFQACEGGGEYNVARGLRRCFGMRTGTITALVDNPIGRLIEDMMLQGGVDTSLIEWVPYDGIGLAARNGINFTDRGFGPRAPTGCSDRGHSAASRLTQDGFDWTRILGKQQSQWLHSGGVFAAIGPSTPAVIEQAFSTARRYNTITSYDINFRDSLWAVRGGRAQASAVNLRILGLVDILFGDISTVLYPKSETAGDRNVHANTDRIRADLREVATMFPNLRAIAMPLRCVQSAGRHGWGAICYVDGEIFEVPMVEIEVFDRVGGGDAFAAGFVYGLLEGESLEWALQCGVAHGALAMSTPGDNSMATRADVIRMMSGARATIDR